MLSCAERNARIAIQTKVNANATTEVMSGERHLAKKHDTSVRLVTKARRAVMKLLRLINRLTPLRFAKPLPRAAVEAYFMDSAPITW